MVNISSLIPQVYNQSRDFSVFTGLIQIIINEWDRRISGIEELPPENVLPNGLSTYSNLKKYFRFLVKNKGSIESIIYALYLCSGDTFSFSDENSYLGGISLDSSTLDREKQSLINLAGKKGINPQVFLSTLIYYKETIGTSTILYLNVKDLSQIDQGLFNKLMYYLKPVNVVIKLLNN